MIRRLSERARKRAGSVIAESFFHGMSRLGRLHPRAAPSRHGVEVIRDVPYREGATRAAGGRRDDFWHLDVWRPTQRTEPLPALIYVHGGGFRILSKDTHWVMALAFARRGFVVFNVGYRLAPEHRFPAAVEDVCDAYAWVAEHAHEYGADTSRMVVAGESAGANLAVGLSIAACYRRPEPFAERVWSSGVTPAVALPACGIFQVSDPGRFGERRPDLPHFVRDRIREVTTGYLPREAMDSSAARSAMYDFADPLLLFERGERPDRPLPAFFLPVGTADPLLDDTRRLHQSLSALGAISEARYYPREIHAFHAFVFRDQARRCWRDTYSFLDRHLPRTS